MIGSLDAGGIQAFSVNISKGLMDLGYTVDFAVDHNEYDFYADIIESLGCNLFFFKAPSYLNVHAYMAQWDEFFRQHPEIDIVHGHARSTAALYLSSARRAGMHTVAHSHSTSNGVGIRGMAKNVTRRQIWRYAEAYLACSEEAGAWLYGKHWMKDAPSYVIQNGIDLDRFAFDGISRCNIRHQLDIDESAHVYGHVGRFNRVKNHEFLLKVFELIKACDPSAVLLLVGDGELRGKIESLVKESALEASVRFVGNVTDAAPYYSVMDLLIFPSLWEGVPLSLVEAQAAGLPIVASDRINEASFVIKDACRILSLGSPGEWARCAIDLSCMQNERGGSTLDDLVNSPYSLANTCRAMDCVYRSLLD